MNHSFHTFLDTYLSIWNQSSISELKEIISKDYQAREITGGEILDFGYEESISGWGQGFHFVKENGGIWDLKVLSILPLRENETLVIISATIVINGKSLETANVFFQTFRKESTNDWKLIRSYIEAEVMNIND